VKETQDIKKKLATLQRLHQISPSNEAMATLLATGIQSAADVVAMGEQAFRDGFGATSERIFGEPDRQGAKDVWRRARTTSPPKRGAGSTCLCGCGQVAAREFLPGHDQRAIHAIIREHYGTVADFVHAHEPIA
jgi:hypothetical protein